MLAGSVATCCGVVDSGFGYDKSSPCAMVWGGAAYSLLLPSGRFRSYSKVNI